MQLEFESARLRFRPVGSDDLDIYTALLTDPDVMRYVALPLSSEDVAAKMPDLVRRGGGGAIGLWVVTRNDTGEKIGEGALLPLPINVKDTEWHLMTGEPMPDRDIEVGYLLKTAAWGQGYGTEICARLLEFAFDNTQLDTIVAVTDPDNKASNHVLEKCGLKNYGLRKAYDDTTTDFRITRTQWRELA